MNDKISILAKKKLLFLMIILVLSLFGLCFRVFYIQTFQGDFLKEKALEQQTRDRLISPNRGAILDRNMIKIAETETVASVSVIHNQIKNKEQVAEILSAKLELDYDTVIEKVSKKLALERIKTKVSKEVADEIRKLNLPGVVVDEDIKRVYPFSTLASQVIGFVGRDNQGIIGLEAKYDDYLKGTGGKILTETDVRGRELKDGLEQRIKPQAGHNLVTSIDVVLQQYAEQTLSKIVDVKQAKRGTIILMNPQNGEIYAMANKPDFDLNEPFTINSPELELAWNHLSNEEQNNALNQMWRNFSINDTYEPGSTFKILTSVAGLQENLITKDTPFTCTGSKLVGGRAIKCWRSPRSHGLQTFTQGVYNSCNPVFMEVAERLGAETFYSYLDKFGMSSKTGIDLPGEAAGIFHKLDKVGPVELATMSFGQSFQITPLQLLNLGSSIVNGGYKITPHFAIKAIDEDGNIAEQFDYGKGEQIISQEVSDTMREILEGVVFEGTGNKTYIPGYRVGGKTATSEKLPRRSGKYISSFLAFAPAEDPVVIALVLVDEPQGAYYGGQVTGPVMKELLETTLPYLNIKPIYSEQEQKLDLTVIVPDLTNLKVSEATKLLTKSNIKFEIVGEGEIVAKQFPYAGEEINTGTKVILYSENYEEG